MYIEFNCIDLNWESMVLDSKRVGRWCGGRKEKARRGKAGRRGGGGEVLLQGEGGRKGQEGVEWGWECR